MLSCTTVVNAPNESYIDDANASGNDNDVPSDNAKRKSFRIRNLPLYLQDYLFNTAETHRNVRYSITDRLAVLFSKLNTKLGSQNIY